MKKIKSNKGVTLIILSITIIVLLIVTSMVLYNMKDQLTIKNVNRLYSDISSISTKISEYYLKNENIPIFENTYIANSTQLGLIFVANGGTKEQINPNDEGAYYVIDLSKLDNLTLNYGREYQNWGESSSFGTYQDIYIINAVTHQIYYPKGIKHEESIYFTMDLENKEISKIETSSITEENIVITLNEANKTTIEETKIILNANITINIDTNYQESSLQYGLRVAGDSVEINYASFSLDDTKSANISSKLLEDSNEYELFIKVIDKNGYEHIITQTITFN